MSVAPMRIIGIGSPFGDDQLGWHVVDALQRNAQLEQFPRQQLSFIKTDRPGTHLLELMQDAEVVILVDAMKSGAPAGTIRCFEGPEIEAVSSPLSSHGFGVMSALKLGQALGSLPGRVILYGIEIHNQLLNELASESYEPDPESDEIEKIVKRIVSESNLLHT